MKYAIKILADGAIEHPTEDFEEARSHAVSLSNWNIECEIIDQETGEALQHFDPYHRACPSGTFVNSNDPIRELGQRGGVPFSPEH